MSIESVKKYLEKFGQSKNVIELEKSTATVELAAQALGVEPARIAKTISFKTPEGCILVVAAGDVKIDNKKFKEKFGYKAKMPAAEEVKSLTGHAIGGVCPFDTKHGVDVFCDVSLKRFETVFPACGSSNSAIKLTCDELLSISRAKEWVDVCKN